MPVQLLQKKLQNVGCARRGLQRLRHAQAATPARGWLRRPDAHFGACSRFAIADWASYCRELKLGFVKATDQVYFFGAEITRNDRV